LESPPSCPTQCGGRGAPGRARRRWASRSRAVVTSARTDTGVADRPRSAVGSRVPESLAPEYTVLTGSVPMPQNTSSHRVIVITGPTAPAVTQTCQRSQILQHRPAPQRIVIIRNGQYTAAPSARGSSG
jgi:hypothetical protein